MHRRMSEMLERIRRETGWSHVREERRTIRWLGKSFRDRKIDLVPSNTEWPEVYFVFSDDYDLLQQFGLGEWHGHPDTDEAIALAADFVAGRKCVLERWTKDKTYAGSGVVTPNEVPAALRQHDGRGGSFRRVFFNQAPRDEG
jgi:hypothetical protein